MTEAQKLFDELNSLMVADPRNDGTYGTDGSYESLYYKFEIAFYELFTFAEDIIENMRYKEMKNG